MSLLFTSTLQWSVWTDSFTLCNCTEDSVVLWLMSFCPIMQTKQICIQIKFFLSLTLSLTVQFYYALSLFPSCCERGEEPMGPIGPWRPAPAPHCSPNLINSSPYTLPVSHNSESIHFTHTHTEQLKMQPCMFTWYFRSVAQQYWICCIRRIQKHLQTDTETLPHTHTGIISDLVLNSQHVHTLKMITIRECKSLRIVKRFL